MDFQTTYNNLQTEMKNKASLIDAKKQEIATLETDIYKLQGASEMLVFVSKQIEEEQKQPEPVDPEKPAEPVEKVEEEVIERPKDEEEVKDAKEQEGYVPVK